MELAGDICRNGPLAVEAILRTIRETGGMTETEGFANEDERADAVFATQDAKEGPLAFLEKRTPNFQRR
jgi:enoyl-CoA hydratase